MEYVNILVRNNANFMGCRVTIDKKNNTIEIERSALYQQLFANEEVFEAFQSYMECFHNDHKDMKVNASIVYATHKHHFSVYKLKRNEYIVGFMTLRRQIEREDSEDPTSE